MHKSKPGVFQRKASIGNSTLKVLNNSSNKNLAFNSLLTTPSMKTNTEVGITSRMEKISPNKQNTLKKNSLTPRLKKNVFTSSFSNLNKSKENDGSINLSKNIYTNNSITDEKESGSKVQRKHSKLSFKMPDDKADNKGNKNSTSFKPRSSINFEGNFNITDDLNGFSNINRTSSNKDKESNLNTNRGFEGYPSKETSNFNNNNNNNNINNTNKNNVTFNVNNTNPNRNLLNTNPMNTSGVNAEFIDNESVNVESIQNTSISKPKTKNLLNLSNNNLKEKTLSKQNSEKNLTNLTKNIATDKNNIFNLLQNTSKKTAGSSIKKLKSNSKKNITDKNSSMNSNNSNNLSRENSNLRKSGSLKNLNKSTPEKFIEKNEKNFRKQNTISNIYNNKSLENKEISLNNSKNNSSLKGTNKANNINEDILVKSNTNNFLNNYNNFNSNKTSTTKIITENSQKNNIINNNNNQNNIENNNIKQITKSQEKKDNNNNINNNINIKQIPDNFNFNYNEEKIFSQNQKINKLKITEDDFIYDFKNDINEENNNNQASNLAQINKFQSKKSYEPLTSIEEIDEKHLQQATEENARSTKENYNNNYNNNTAQNFNSNSNQFNSNFNSNSNSNIIQKEKEEENKSNFELIMQKLNEDNNNNEKGKKNKTKNEKNSANFTPNFVPNNPTNNSVFTVNMIGKNGGNNVSPLRKTFKNELEIEDKFMNLKSVNSNNNVNNFNPIPVTPIEERERKQQIYGNINVKEYDYSEKNEKNNEININNHNNFTENRESNIISPIAKGSLSSFTNPNMNNNNNNFNNMSNNKENNTILKGSLTSFNNISLNKESPESLYHKNKQKKLSDLDDILVLKNLIDDEQENNNNSNINKTDKNESQNKKISPLKKRSTLNNSQLKRELKLIENQKQEIPSNKRFSLQKTSTLKANLSNKNLNNSTSKKPNNRQNSNLSNSKLMNSTMNKGDKSSFIDDDSKILVTNLSKNVLRTGGNEISSTKMFTKLFEKNKSVGKSIKSPNNNNSLIGKDSKGKFTTSVGKINTDNITSKIDTGLSEGYKRKSLSIKPKDKKPDFIGRLSNKNNNNNNNNNNSSINQSMENSKKKSNFISRKSLNFTKTQSISSNKVVDTIAGSKLSKQSILGKIISSRNIKGDDRNMLTDINFEVANTQQDVIGHRRSLKNFNNSSKNHNGFDFEFERKFSSSLRGNNPLPKRGRNKSLIAVNSDKKINNKMPFLLKVNSDKLNKSMNLENGGKFENIKIRINRNHIIHRMKIKDKKLKDKNILKGKYEFEEKYDPTFMNKLRYEEKELFISSLGMIKLNEKPEEKQPLILPINLRRDQREEINNKLNEKLKGNFIDESIIKITKLNRLERLNNSRRESMQLMNKENKKLSIDYSNNSNETCRFNTINPNSNTKSIEVRDSMNSFNPKLLEKNFTQNFNEKSRKVSMDIENRSIIYNNKEINNNNINNNMNLHGANKSEKKIGNSKVFLLDNNFVICNNNFNDERVYSAFNSIDSYAQIFTQIDVKSPKGNKLNIPSHIVLSNNSTEKDKYNINKRLERLTQLEKLSNKEFNLTKTSIKHHSRNNSNNNQQNISILMEVKESFTSDVDNRQNYQNENRPLREKRNSAIKKIIEIKNVINLQYLMHPEKNELGFYSFSNNNNVISNNINTVVNTNENYSNLELGLNKQNSNNYQANEKINPNNNNNLYSIENNNISNNDKFTTNFYSQNKQNKNNHSVKEVFYNKINFPMQKENENYYERNNNNEMNNINNNYIGKEIINANIIKEDQVTFAENIRRNVDDIDFFDKIKRSLESKRNFNSIKTMEILGKKKSDDFDINNINTKNLRKNSIEKVNSNNNDKTDILVHPTNNNNKIQNNNNINYNEYNNLNNNNISNISSIKSLSISKTLNEKKKRESSLEILNQKFNEKLVILKHKKPLNQAANCNSNSNDKKNLNNNNNKEENLDEDFESFKNEFKRSHNYNPIGLNKIKSNDLMSIEEFTNIKNDIVLNDEKLSEFNDKFFKKTEFLDKNQMNNFYKKHLKTNKDSLFHNKNPYLIQKENNWIQENPGFSLKEKEEKDIQSRLLNLKGILNINDNRNKNQNKQNDNYNQKEKNRKNYFIDRDITVKNEGHHRISSNVDNSNLTHLINLNESKVNNLGYTERNLLSPNEKLNNFFSNNSTIKFGNNGLFSTTGNFNRDDLNYNINNNNLMNREGRNTIRDKPRSISEFNLESGFQSTKMNSFNNSNNPFKYNY